MESVPRRTIAHIFGTPLVWRGWLSLPWLEVVLWGVLAWRAGRVRPQRSLAQRLGVGLLSVPFVIGWEWLHNFAHAGAARLAGRPMDALEVTAGTPICIYSLENHRGATPRQHMLRTLGGPLFNLAAMIVTRLLRALSRPGLARELLDLSVNANTFLGTASLLPIPGIDGGPLLQWGLVAAGQSSEQAGEAVKKVDLALSPWLGLLAGWFFRRGHPLWGGWALFFAATALAVGKGWMRGETRET